MSIRKPPNSPYWQYDFQFKGRRFLGSTKLTNRREALAFERAERDRAKLETAQSVPSTSTKLDDVAGRYWQEVGQHHVGHKTTFRDIARLLSYFDKTKLLTEITDSDVAHLVAWRRGQRVTRHGKGLKNAKQAPFVAKATVNRSTTEMLKKLFTRAKAWGIKFEHEPNWKMHLLKEPEWIVREIQEEQSQRIEAATRDDYRPVMEFAAAAGFRLNECLLRWSEVNWDTRTIAKPGKGSRLVRTKITTKVRTILWPLRGHHDEFVFTYIAKRTRKKQGLIKGQRYPVTYSGLKSAWKRNRSLSGVDGVRFHDIRHDFAMKLLRKTKNLRLVQSALNHADIKTTTRYAHTSDDDLAAGLEEMQNSRTNLRTTPRKAG